MARSAFVLGILVLAAGCAGLGSAAPAPQTSGVVSSRISAARMYQTAEAMVEEGYHTDAVRLMRHAILSLPRTADVDELRHALVMRMAHVQLLAAEADADLAYAQDAATMLLAYGERHEMLFGNEHPSEHEDIYELLFAAETYAEALQATEPSPTSVAPRLSSAVVTGPVDTHAGEELEPEITRNVRVRREWFYDPDDPRVRDQLESWFSDAGGYTFMTTPGTAVLSGPRPMVRRTGRLTSIPLQGASDPTAQSMRQVARAALRTARPALRDCYRSAAARGGVLQTEATLEFTATSDGALRDVVVVAGDVVDGLGDACVIEQLSDTVLTDDAPQAAVRIQMPLLFFYDGPDLMQENERTDGAVNYDGPKPVWQPGIDTFDYPTDPTSMPRRGGVTPPTTPKP